MPSIKHNGFSLIIRTNDHDPSHVHVMKGGDELVFVLGDGDPYLKRILSPMKKGDARNALEAVKARRKDLLDLWGATHERNNF